MRSPWSSDSPARFRAQVPDVDRQHKGRPGASESMQGRGGGVAAHGRGGDLATPSRARVRTCVCVCVCVCAPRGGPGRRRRNIDTYKYIDT